MLPSLIAVAKVLISIWLEEQSGAFGTHFALTSEDRSSSVCTALVTTVALPGSTPPSRMKHHVPGACPGRRSRRHCYAPQGRHSCFGLPAAP